MYRETNSIFAIDGSSLLCWLLWKCEVKLTWLCHYRLLPRRVHTLTGLRRREQPWDAAPSSQHWDGSKATPNIFSINIYFPTLSCHVGISNVLIFIGLIQIYHWENFKYLRNIFTDGYCPNDSDGNTITHIAWTFSEGSRMMIIFD